jgi:hypothetical protein
VWASGNARTDDSTGRTTANCRAGRGSHHRRRGTHYRRRSRANQRRRR